MRLGSRRGNVFAIRDQSIRHGFAVPPPFTQGGRLKIRALILKSFQTVGGGDLPDAPHPRPTKSKRTTPSVILSVAPLDPATGMWRLRFDYGLRPSLRMTRGRNRTPQVQPLCGWDLDGAMFPPSPTNKKQARHFKMIASLLTAQKKIFDKFLTRF